ncbi:hypothetical protein ABIB40_002518 [Pedobacter sp. UYP30]|uniref:beta-1,6-N-acetylglucosaminyltransferase n=1 Tax=Pedobacter sp. UYP30 TaxID=1756400 RepID=UPI003393CCD6
MKKAYLIMAHKYPSQLCRLVDRLNDGLSHFFIHIDKKVDISQFDSLKVFGDKVVFIDRFDGQWGRYGTTLPLLAGLKTIKHSLFSFDRIILLSGQDYPIKSNKEINEFFQSSPYSVFINFFPIPNLEKWPGKDRGGLYRIDKYYFGEKWCNRVASRTLNLLSIPMAFLRRRIPKEMAAYTGSAWINLDMYALNYILDFHEKNPEYLKFHRNSFVADEVFIHMIVGNSRDEGLLARMQNSEKRFIIWESPQSPHPKILQSSDFKSIKLSEDLFARKFDEEADAEILDLIDSELLFKE